MTVIDKKRNTPCKHCIFALYQNNVQIDCYNKLLKKFQNNNAEIIEAFDEDKEFFIISGRKCLMARSEIWTKKQLEENKNFGTNKLAKLAYKEIELTCDVVIYLDINSHSVDELKLTLLSLANQVLKPSQVSIVINNFHIDKKEKLDELYGIVVQMLTNICEYRIHLITEPNIDYLRTMDIIIKKFSNWDIYFMLIKCGAKMPRLMLYDLDQSLHHELIECVLMLPDKNEDFLFSQISFFKNISGNKYGSFKQLASEHIKKFQCQHLIKSIPEMCPNCR